MDVDDRGRPRASYAPMASDREIDERIRVEQGRSNALAVPGPELLATDDSANRAGDELRTPHLHRRVQPDDELRAISRATLPSLLR